MPFGQGEPIGRLGREGKIGRAKRQWGNALDGVDFTSVGNRCYCLNITKNNANNFCYRCHK